MKIKFDANQDFQIDAIASITKIFEGLPMRLMDYSIVKFPENTGLFSAQDFTLRGAGNCIVDFDALRKNVRRIQKDNDIFYSDADAPLDAWHVKDSINGQARLCPHFSVEMETGTGKTYVYLRTIFELSKLYGMQKFIIVVPSIAIREGVLKSLEIMEDHFKGIYNNPVFEYTVYDSKKAKQMTNRLRQFATSNSLQILVMNIDAFRKDFSGTEDEKKSNVIFKQNESLSGRPIDFIQATRPIVIIDEPQSVDATERAQDAIKRLNPLCTLRYSATHRNRYNLTYRLDPVKAFELNLVKKIEVASARTSGISAQPFVRLEAVDNKQGLRAKVRIKVQGKDGPKEKTVTLKQRSDLYIKSGNLSEYEHGFRITEISLKGAEGSVSFSSGEMLVVGQEIGGYKDDVSRIQIRETIREHLRKELLFRDLGVKVLSLFFIDKVANYRNYDDQGSPVKGKYALVFEEELAQLLTKPEYQDLEISKLSIDRLHNGYFAADKRGILRDTNGETAADDDVYSLIMKYKEKLLSISEPLRFIFSHSALREGWDNPNVFQICTLNETYSQVKKRQEIGRGLRLPVDQTGERVRDESINRLYVMANESYEDFAKALQTEYEIDCGVVFDKVPIEEFAKLRIEIDGEEHEIGKDSADAIVLGLIEQGFINNDGKILPYFDPRRPDFLLGMPPGLETLVSPVIDLLSKYQMNRHIRKANETISNKFRSDVSISPEFKRLWDQIKVRTTYRVEFDTNDLVNVAVAAIKKMPQIEEQFIEVASGLLDVKTTGISTVDLSRKSETVNALTQNMPDLIAYLQNKTLLTRSTLIKILIESERLHDFFLNSQLFMDSVAKQINIAANQLLVSGIKYERISKDGGNVEWEMQNFRPEELVDGNRAQKVGKSIYEYVYYQSDVERRFAEVLDSREDIKLFIKLPAWFKIDTPLGTYNPDWAITKYEDKTIYLVRETKGTTDETMLRGQEADKIKCGARHFKLLGVDFAVVDDPRNI